jgi:hypothetical protein
MAAIRALLAAEPSAGAVQVTPLAAELGHLLYLATQDTTTDEHPWLGAIADT